MSMEDLVKTGKTIEIAGAKVEVKLNPSYCQFVVEADGDRPIITGYSLDQVIEEAKKYEKQIRVEYAIPVVMESSGNSVFSSKAKTYIRAILRARHSRNSSYLFTMADGTKRQIEYPKVVCRGDKATDRDIERLNELAVKLAEANKALYVEIERLSAGDKRLECWMLIEDAARAVATKKTGR